MRAGPSSSLVVVLGVAACQPAPGATGAVVRRCTNETSMGCFEYVGSVWTEASVRDSCASGVVSEGPCAPSPYGTCIVGDGAPFELRSYFYAAGFAEALLAGSCCTTGSSTPSGSVWISAATGARTVCAADAGVSGPDGG